MIVPPATRCNPNRTILNFKSQMLHFRNRVSEEARYELCSRRLPELDSVLGGMHRWVQLHPETLDRGLQAPVPPIPLGPGPPRSLAAAKHFTRPILGSSATGWPS